MLYIFECLGKDWIKIGFTSQHDPWIRITNGFWTNIHPPDLCGLLAPENLNLIFLFDGDRQMESVFKSLFPPDCGEFWHKNRLEEIVSMLRLMTEERSIPPRPVLVETGEKLPCCGGTTHKCYTCGRIFKREHKLWQHKREVHEKRTRVTCSCGDVVLGRHLNRHLNSKRHKA